MRLFFDHTLPLLVPVLLVAIVLRTIDAIGTFDQIYVLTKGGPGTATRLISIYAYNTAFLFTQYGQAAAMLIMLLGDGDAAHGRGRADDAEGGAVRRPAAADRPLRDASAIILLIAIFPFWWMVDTSFKQPVDIFGGVTLYPHNPTTAQLRAACSTPTTSASYLENSLIIVTVSVAVSLAHRARSRPTPWPASELRFGLNQSALVVALLVRMIPGDPARDPALHHARASGAC